jgi:hypothetical protein
MDKAFFVLWIAGQIWFAQGDTNRGLFFTGLGFLAWAIHMVTRKP